MESEDFTCSSYQVSQIITGLIAGSIFVLVATLVISMLTYRRYIKILLFDKLSLRFFDKQREIEGSEHDIYLLYADEDYYWIQHTLLTGLERRGFRVFDYNRDSVGGTPRAETIERAMSRSHRVLILFTQLFCEDDDALAAFCRAEAHQDARLNKRFLIFLTTESGQRHYLNAPDNVFHMFQRYLRLNHVIQIHSPRFWPQLLYMLPDIPLSLDVR